MSATAIDYIELDSENLGASRTFFTAAFGWRFTDYGPDYAGIEDAKLDGGISQAEGARKLPLVILYTSDLDTAEAAVRALMLGNGDSIPLAPQPDDDYYSASLLMLSRMAFHPAPLSSALERKKL